MSDYTNGTNGVGGNGSYEGGAEWPMIGRVLRADTLGFACGTNSNDLDLPSFGAFVIVPSRGPEEASVIGVISAIRVEDDALVRQLVLANRLNTATIRDQRENRLVPVEISIIHVGYQYGDDLYQGLPPRPPVSLEPVYLCDSSLVRAFTGQFDFFRLVLGVSDAPPEELIAATIRQSAAALPPHMQREYLVKAGRRLAQLLSGDLLRLNHTLRLIQP